VYENIPGSDVWYVRVAHRKRIHRKKVGPHSLAIKVYNDWKAKIASGTFFPNAIATSDELLTDAIKAYQRRRDDLGANGNRILQSWADAPETKGKTVREFTTEDAEAFLKRRATAGRYAPSTRNKDVAYLFTFFEWFEDGRRRKRAHEPPIANPLKGLRKSEKEHERVRYLSDTEEQRLLTALPSDLDRAIVLVAIHSGLRAGNLFGLDWDRHVNLQARTIQGWSRKGRAKALRRWTVAINDTLLAVLRSLPSYPDVLCELEPGQRRWVFSNAARTSQLDAKNWYHRVWRPALETAGISNLHLHDLRHTTATRLLASPDVKLPEIAAALGHADTRMTERYAHLQPGRMLDVMQTLAAPRVLTTNLAPPSATPNTADERPEVSA
jgi:integrase